MINLRYSGENIVAFAAALLLTQLIIWSLSKWGKNDKFKHAINNNWYNVVLSVVMFVIGSAIDNDSIYVGEVGILSLIVSLIIALIGIKKTVIAEKHISDWAIGIVMIIFGVGEVSFYSYPYIEYIIIGIIWILITVFWKSKKVWKLSVKNSLGVFVAILGLIAVSVGNYAMNNTAHIVTDNYSVKLGKKYAYVSGVATPNTKVYAYQDGYRIDSQKTDKDGYFSFKIEDPGKVTVKVSKNGNTDSDYTIVKTSPKNDYTFLKERFISLYSSLGAAVEDLSSKEGDEWNDAIENSDDDFDVDATIESIEDKHSEDIKNIALTTESLHKTDQKIQKNSYASESDKETIHDAYLDMKHFSDHATNIHGSYDDFIDEHNDLDQKVADHAEELQDMQ